MKHEWQQYIFTPEDFEGAGQYIVKETRDKINSPHIMNTGYLSTVMNKVGYCLGTRRNPHPMSNIYCLVDMSDGLIHEGYFSNTGKIVNGRYEIPIQQWIWNEFSGENNYVAKQKLCDYLNNNPHGETFRKATHEEVIRVVAYQKHRTA